MNESINNKEENILPNNTLFVSNELKQLLEDCLY